ncbi:hypothetical protein ALC60_00343 [Trachymyrmex zeteki]|uniref:Uncharacterized protein n=1 Tax=Mycetomoellerius zeteki TaxID=64791 RepID=A0A151XKA8_9HYME|nr:hypothetical protein ALC60_00343 [Trachymyrmex zeteki]
MDRAGGTTPWPPRSLDLNPANVTADLLNRISYVTCDIEIREIVSFKI